MRAFPRVAMAGLAPVALVLSLALTTARVQEYRVRPYLHANLYLPSGKLVEQTSLGYRELAADLVWFQAVQYFGGYAKSEHGLAYFNSLIEIVTDLDPHFQFPYVFGAIVMSQDMGDFSRGINILKKGMRANPEAWEYPFEIAFLYFITHNDATSAAHYFELAARQPGGGDRARRFAAFMYSRAGHADTSIRMWEELAETSDQPYMKDIARRYIEQIRKTGRIAGEQHDG